MSSIIFPLIIIIVIGLVIYYLTNNLWVSMSVFIVILLIYLIVMRGMRRKEDKEDVFPSSNWMKYVGSRCPDYWQFQGQVVNPGNLKGTYNKCYNNPSEELSVDVPDNNTCYDDVTGRLKYFPVFKKWPPEDEQDEKTKKQICTWMNQCGPSKKQDIFGNITQGSVPASWQGMLC
jgi:Ca2+/Na+ antiporter